MKDDLITVPTYWDLMSHRVAAIMWHLKFYMPLATFYTNMRLMGEGFRKCL